MESPKVLNLNAAKKLAEKYDSITEKDLLKVKIENNITSYYLSPKIINYLLNNITGFGRKQSCILCIEAISCTNCLYFKHNQKHITTRYCVYHKTYNDILNSANMSRLLLAIKARSKVLKTFIKKKS